MSADAAVFHLTLRIGRRLFWEVDADGIIEVPDVTACTGVLLSFDSHDHRLCTAGPLGTRPASQRFMREWGETVRLVNDSRRLATLYGRDPAHGPQRPASCRLHSGLQLMDLLARARGIPRGAGLLGLRLGAEPGQGRCLILLFAYDAKGELLRFQEAANPPSLAYFVEDFGRGLPTGVAGEPHWFDQTDVRPVLAELRPYPEEDTVGEIPVRVCWEVATRACAALTTVALLWSAWGALEVRQLGRTLSGQNARISAQRLEGAGMLAQHAMSLAASRSVDLAHLFFDAETLWRPGTRIRVQGVPEYLDYAVLLGQGPIGDSRPASGPAWQPHPQRAALDAGAMALPAGIHPLDPALGGDLHANYLRFRRETPLPALAALVGREPDPGR